MKRELLYIIVLLMAIGGVLLFWGAIPQGLIYIPIAAVLVLILNEAVKRLPIAVWLVVGLVFITALFLPDAIMSAIFPGRSLNSSAELAYIFTITPALIVAALLLAAGMRRMSTAVSPRPNRWLTTAVLLLSLLLIAKAIHSFYWFIVWDNTGDSLAYLWLFFPSIGLIMAGFILFNTMSNRRKILSVGYVLLLLPTLFAVSAAARQVDYRALTAQRADQVVDALGKYHVWNGHYPQDLGELSPRYIIAIPRPFIIYGQDWCYESDEVTYRLSYVDRDHWSDPRLFGRVHTAAMPPADEITLSRPCAAEIAAIQTKYPTYPYTHKTAAE